MRINRLTGPVAHEQARWIAASEPWRGMGYTPAGLGRWLRRMALRGCVWGARRDDELLGVVVVQADVLLGDFIALLAVAPAASRQGVGHALVAHVESRTWKRRCWLWVSSDADNRVAARFYRHAGFTRVARLPDLVRAGHDEVLWRKARPDS